MGGVEAALPACIQEEEVGRAFCQSFKSASQVCSGTDEDPDDKSTPFRQRPFCKYKGHTADLLDLSWSKVRGPISSGCSRFKAVVIAHVLGNCT